jgi:uncharacterized protein (TIGR03067 family)
MGRALDNAVKGYNTAVGSFEGMLVPRARELADLGVPGSKKIELLDPVEIAIRQVVIRREADSAVAHFNMNPKSSYCALDGTWQLLRAQLSGEEAPDLMVKRTTMQFSGGFYRVKFGAETTDAGTYEITQNNAMRSLTLFSTSGTNRGRTIPCVFQQVGNRLRVCCGLDGIQPPDFTTKAGQHRYLAMYRRIHP